MSKKNEEALVILSYDITYDPIKSKYREKLPRRIRAKMDDMFHSIPSNPQFIIDEYSKVTKKHQNNPMLLNYLAAAYSHQGDLTKAKEIAFKNYKINKDYLFAKINYAQMCIEEESYAEIYDIFDRKGDLRLLYPKRKTFHIDEFLKFNWVMGVYFFNIGEPEKADMYYKALKSVEPRNLYTKALKKLIHPSFLRRWLLKKKKQLNDKKK